MSFVQLGGQRAQLGLGGQRGLGVVGPPHRGRDDRAQLVRQPILHVPDLVKFMPTSA
jgi:hypothetical protein